MRLLLFIGLFLMSETLLARTIARVIEVQGNAFSFQGSNPVTLKYGDELADMSDVMVEDGGALSIVTTDDKILHISSGSLVKVYRGLVELKNGYVWVESNNRTKGIINTSNSITHYDEGQFIYSFDNISGKTQVLVLEGDVKFSNSLEPDLTAMVTSGYFSLVDQEYEKGLPRTPTKVGLKSYKQTKEIFANFKVLQNSKFEESIWGEKKAPMKTQVNTRGIASVSPKSSKRGKMIYVQTIKGKRSPASVASPLSYYLSMKKKAAVKLKPVKTKKVAPIKYYGFNTVPSKAMAPMAKNPVMPKVKTVKVVKPAQFIKKAPVRAPASIQKANLINELKKSDFEKSLDQQVPKNRRNSDEVNGLIDELKSYDQDYKKKF